MSHREDPVQTGLQVWISYKDDWFPGILETWNTKDGVMRGWVSYSVPVNGWHGGWYDLGQIRSDDPSIDVDVDSAP